MRRTTVICLAIAAALFATGPSLAQTPAVGAQVKDSRGVVVGVVEKVVSDAQGRPRQVQVREGRLLRTLPIDGLKADGAGFSTELTKAEFEALPGVE